ncbi:MAG TPA: hypothetical protein VGJ00_10445 [Rhabdochlamydiaceae bacterium]|jgi:hypothetical protein
MQNCDNSTVDDSSNNIKLREHLRECIASFVGEHETYFRDIIDALAFNIILAFSKVHDSDNRTREINFLCGYLKAQVGLLSQYEGANEKVL